jgi:HAD superfamily hydrolase (TIGR01509 family)
LIRALIFDFDGLILDSESPTFASWAEVFRSQGAELKLEVWSRYIGLVHGSFDPQEHLERALGRQVDMEPLRAERRRRFRELLEAQPIMPGVLDYLDGARRLDLQTAVASSAPGEYVRGELRRLGLFARFDAVLCGEDAPRCKPAPDLYRAALAALGASASDAVALEDSPNGVAAAKAAGLFCLAVPNAVTRGLDLCGADLVAGSLAELPLEELVRRAASAGGA